MLISIIVPCYNEAGNIGALIDRIRPLQEKYNLEYVLVENGSNKDNSKEYFKTNIENKFPQIKVVYVEVNQGYGYGLQQGMKAASGDYVGWIHADLQIPPEELIQFFDEIEKHSTNENEKGKKNEKLFLKGTRTNRRAYDTFFTHGQSLFNSMLFGRIMYDVGAIPVIFSKSLLDEVPIDSMPNDFGIETFIYLEALRHHFKTIRFKVRVQNRKKGDSSWDHGIKSKIKQSIRIFNDSIKIRKGEKVL